jgi:hypothetical protein
MVTLICGIRKVRYRSHTLRTVAFRRYFLLRNLLSLNCKIRGQLSTQRNSHLTLELFNNHLPIADH